jgi:hypothetical protein
MNNLFEILESVTILLLAVSGLKQANRIKYLEKSIKLTDQYIEAVHENTGIKFKIQKNLIKGLFHKNNKEYKLIQSHHNELVNSLNEYQSQFRDNVSDEFKIVHEEISKMDKRVANTFLKVGNKLGVTKKEDEILSKKVDKSKGNKEKFDFVKEYENLFNTIKDKNLTTLEILNYIEDSSKVSPKVYQTLLGKTPKEKSEKLFQMIERSKLLTKQEIEDQKHILKRAKKYYKVGTNVIPVEVIPSLKRLTSSYKASACQIISPIFDFKGDVLYARVSSYTSVPIYYNGHWAEIIPSTNE